jgi:uridine kinase
MGLRVADADCVAQVAGRIVAAGALRVAVTGVDAAGKTQFAARLAQALQERGQAVLLAHVDDFHNPRAVRYRHGRQSAEGFYRDTTDLAGLRAALLEPLALGGDRWVRTRIFDHCKDCGVDVLPTRVATGTILILEGVFLIRPELGGCFDLTLFLDVPFAETFRRMALRDGTDPDPLALTSERYRRGQEIWMEEVHPRDVADLLIDNSDFAAPKLVEMRGGAC